MSKRFAREAIETGEDAFAKRQKLKHTSGHSPEDIQSARQLAQLLAFDQDQRRAGHGIASFKTFLDTLNNDANTGRQAILIEYLTAQRPNDEGDNALPYLNDLMQTWSFASQSNNDSLLSAVPAVLALLLRTTSSSLELSKFGLRLGTTLLQKRQLELLARGLTSNKSKEFVISPCLRLLKEVTIFDGGTLAKQIFKLRDYTWKGLGRNLGLKFGGDGLEDRKKPSVRTNAVRFLLAYLKYVHADGRHELVNQRDIIAGLLRDVTYDPPYIVRDILETLRIYVLQETTLKRETRTKVLNATTLVRFLNLYEYDQEDHELASDQKSVPDLAHEFLLLGCTSVEHGILNRQNGFYPRGMDVDGGVGRTAPGFIDLGLENSESSFQYIKEVPIRNTAIADFLQVLKPWSNLRQSELLLAVFQAAPEVVADYFLKKKTFTFDPKLTATWIGYSAFLFSAIQLPLPPFFGLQDCYGRSPPPSSVVLESILPSALNQKALIRCLNHTSPLVSFFAIRLLTNAIEKLAKAIVWHEEASRGSSLWRQAASRLQAEFILQCPSIKDVLNVYRTMPFENQIQRQAVTRLLVLYYAHLPQVALESKIDVSTSLAQMLKTSASNHEDALYVMELENLFQLASYAPAMRWYTASEGHTASPFVTMIRMTTEIPKELRLERLQRVLQSTAVDSGLFNSLDALEATLTTLKMFDQAKVDPIYAFLDNCIARCTANPIKYVEALDNLSVTIRDGSSARPLSLSLMALAISDQFAFVVKDRQQSIAADLAHFTASYFAALVQIGEDENGFKSLLQTIATHLPTNSTIRKDLLDFNSLTHPVKIQLVLSPNDNKHDATKHSIPESLSPERLSGNTFLKREKTPLDTSALLRWRGKEADEIVDEGHAAALVVLLTSEHLNIRREALVNISKMAMHIRQSTYEEREQLWVLLSELAESAQAVIQESSVPTTITAFATHAMSILCNPLHCLYPKMNKFLSRGPTWDTSKIPLLHSIIDEPPTTDDTYHQELSWLLTYLSAALQTSGDLAVFHKRHVFEKLLTLYGNIYLTTELKRKILQVVFDATEIQGGSDTLITRFGFLSWVKAQKQTDKQSSLLQHLEQQVQDTSDTSRITVWKLQPAQKRKQSVL